MDVTNDVALLGERLRQWRMVRELPAKVVAFRAGITTSTLRKIEAGEGDGVRLSALVALVRVYGIEQAFFEALDPLNTDIGRIRASNLGRKRVPR